MRSGLPPASPAGRSGCAERGHQCLAHVLSICPGCLFRQIDGVISARRLRLAMNSPTDEGPFVRLGYFPAITMSAIRIALLRQIESESLRDRNKGSIATRSHFLGLFFGFRGGGKSKPIH